MVEVLVVLAVVPLVVRVVVPVVVWAAHLAVLVVPAVVPATRVFADKISTKKQDMALKMTDTGLARICYKLL